MPTPFHLTTRRSFLQSTVAGLGGLTGFEHLLRAADSNAANPRDWTFQYDGEIEPIVRLMEEKPLEFAVEELIARLKRGMSYRQFVAALFQAGRNGRIPLRHDPDVATRAEGIRADVFRRIFDASATIGTEHAQ